MLVRKFVVMLFGGIACGPPPPVLCCVAAPSPSPGTIVGASVSRTWAATIDLFGVQHIPIEVTVEDSGLIMSRQTKVPRRSIYAGMPVGQYEPNPSAQLWADCGKRDGMPLEPETMTYTALVSGDSLRSTILITARFWSGYGTYCATKGALEHEVEATIASAAEQQ